MVSTILGALGAGDSIDDVLEDYPGITQEDLQAIFEFASKMTTLESHPYDAVA